MGALISQILLKHLGELLRVKSHLKDLKEICKSNLVWDLWSSMLVYYGQDLKRQFKEIKGGIYKINLELEVNSIRGQL